jgi:hypothetical protein
VHRADARQPAVAGGPGASGPAAGPIERGSAGLAALFEGVPKSRGLALLDLGAADGDSLAVYQRFARWIRFADVLTAAATPTGWPETLRSLPANPPRPYDLVFAWDALERLPPEEHPRLLARLSAISARGAKLLILLQAPDDPSLHLLSFSLRSTGRLRAEPTGEIRPPHPSIPPAAVKGLLEPFRLHRAFTTRVGLREYVAINDMNG